MKKIIALLFFLVSLFSLTLLANASTVSNISLDNDTAEIKNDCPGTGSYWHFVFAPNNGSSEFVKIVLNLSGSNVEFSGSQIISNSGQKDNVFVAVPSGFTIYSLLKNGSYATYYGASPINFLLSHVCVGETPTTTTSSTTTSTTTAISTTTTVPRTTSTTVNPTTTTTAPTGTTLVTTTTRPQGSSTTTSTTVPEPEIGDAAVLARTGRNYAVVVILGLVLIISGFFLTRRSQKM